MSTMTTDPASPTYVEMSNEQYAGLLAGVGVLVALTAALLFVQIGSSGD